MNEADSFQSRSEKEIFFEALDKNTPQERAAFLDGACGKNSALRARVEALLADHFQEDAFMNKPAVASREETVIVKPLEQPGDKIGRYKLLQQIGEGGCGVVYMAEQEEPVRRRVALKVIKLGMDTKSVVARFEAERQALALMDHPNIAKVLEAGATDTGRPYFVMELVRGIKITDYCDENNLSTVARLELFVLVCQAIQHAHQKGIIHRDIKPSNILVTVNDGVPVPKVIDFGIAKATQGRLTDHTLFTAFEQFLGTPAYMSPEQAEMTSLDIDTRSDIYSLGVLLYELLTSKTPFDAKELMQAGLDEIRRTIREQEPARPSTRLSTMLGADLTLIAKQRKAEPPKLIHLLRGDLDWIVMKALEKDRTRRYETANGLVADIQRHLNHEPVVACPPTNLYRFQKLVGRNKLAFAAAASISIVLVLGAVVSTSEAIRARRASVQALAEKQRADEEAAKQEAVNRFLNEMLGSANPEAQMAGSQAKGRNVTVLQALDAAARQLDAGALKDRPAIEAAIRQTLGKTYLSLGQVDAAENQLRKALELNRRVYGDQSKNTAGTLSDMVRLRQQQDNLDEAEKLARDVLSTQRVLNGQEHAEVALALDNLGDVLARQSLGSPAKVNTEKADAAETTYRAALAMQRKVLLPEDRDLARTLSSLAEVLNYEEKYDEAELLLREALRIQEKLFGPEHPDVALTDEMLAEMTEKNGSAAEAEEFCRAAIAIQRKTLGNDHPALGTSLLELAYILNDRNRIEEAENACRESLTIRRKALGEDNLDVVWCLRTLALNLVAQKRLPEAEELYRRQLPIWAKIRGADSDGYAESVKALADLLKSENKPANVDVLYREVLAAQRAALGDNSSAVAETLSGLSDNLRSQGKQSEAEKVSRDALDITLKLIGLDSAKLPSLLRQETQNLAALGKALDAEKLYTDAIRAARQNKGSKPFLADLLHDFAQFLDYQENKPSAGVNQYLQELSIRRAYTNDDLHYALRGLGDALLSAGNPKEAEPYLREALAVYRKLHQQDEFYATVWTVENLGDALYQQHRLPEAEQAYREALATCEKLGTARSEEYLAWAFKSLGAALYEQHKLPEAEQAYRQALASCVKVGATRSEEYSDVVGLLGNVLAAENKPLVSFYQEVLADQRSIHGEGSPAVLETLISLADHLRAQGKQTDADKALQEAVDTSHKLLQQRSGSELPGALNAINDVVNSCYSVGRDKEATSLSEQICELNPKDTDASLHLAILQTWFGQDADYETTRRRLVREAEGTDQAGTAERAAKACCLRPSTDTALSTKALSLARRAVELGKNSDFMRYYQLCLGLAEYRNSDFAMAEGALATTEKNIGEHPDLQGTYLQGTARFFRVMCLFQQNRPEEARKLFTQAETEMPPFPKDERKPLVDGKPVFHEVLICWLAYKEAKALIEDGSKAGDHPK